MAVAAALAGQDPFMRGFQAGDWQLQSAGKTLALHANELS